MSNLNIKRAVENITTEINSYTPLVEVIVNSIQAIDEKKNQDGRIEIEILRSGQKEFDDALPEIVGFSIKDNGIGFTQENRDSFDTLYSDKKMDKGGKGFGRFTCLKYFQTVSIESIFEEKGSFFKRSFDMGRSFDIIVNEKKCPSNLTETGSSITLFGINSTNFTEKKLKTIARTLVEKILPFFISKQKAPQIILREADKQIDNSEEILNDYLTKAGNVLIQEVVEASKDFTITCRLTGRQTFKCRVFKFYHPRSQNSKVSLVAHRREVSSSSLSNYIPEFCEEFYDKTNSGLDDKSKNFVIKVYVISDYLDKNVCLERGGFKFSKTRNTFYDIGQTEIEAEASKLAKKAVISDVNSRSTKKEEKVKEYVRDSAPWHSSLMSEIDLTDLPYKPSEEEIEAKLQKEKFFKEKIMRREVNALLQTNSLEELKAKATEIANKVTTTSKNELAHYISLRKSVIDLFNKSLETNENQKYSAEGVVHDIIFPRGGDSGKTPFYAHNLWLIDERLNFTEYVASDKTLKGNKDKPDLIAYGRRFVFRGDNEPSNPVTIFELKKPHREDFINKSEKEDPIEQIIRYVRRLRSGDFKTQKGREILINSNTPFYGYLVCTFSNKVKIWLKEQKNFKPMPDMLGYFYWHESLNMYIEALDWDKVLKDAQMRNRIFFEKLGI